MPTYHTYNVIPTLPAALEPLREMVFNLWWTWEPSARRLFRHLDPELWNRTNHNPVRMLQLSRQARLVEVAQDKSFLRELKEVHDAFRKYLARKDTYGKTGTGSAIEKPIAYFSAEFGFHESIPNYSGGLGILAGDHCKSASDLDLNFVAIGLLYRHGYFKQQIDKDGVQQAISLNQNFHHLPIREVRSGDSNLLISVRLLDREVWAKIWELHVGRISLYLLDTDIAENKAEDRLITAELYGGDLEMRMRQEIVLGIGGVKALTALGIEAEVFHMNEGHSAFLALERIRLNVAEKKLDFYSALQVVASANVFTTHTPVPAGNDAFPREMMRRYFGDFAAQLQIPFDEFFRFGQTSVNPLRRVQHDDSGVARQPACERREQIARRSEPVALERCLGGRAGARSADHQHHQRHPHQDLDGAGVLRPLPKISRRLGGAPDRARFLARRDRYSRRAALGNAPEIETASGGVCAGARAHGRASGWANRRNRSAAVNRILDPEILTIGFARRFATYKRGALLFSDQERLQASAQRRHAAGAIHFRRQSRIRGTKAARRSSSRFTNSAANAGFENRIVFVEDYDTYIARRLVQGVDLWLNNPLRPLEASGTSGMKLPPNGGLNLSVLDGWWCESYNGNNGWAIGSEIKDGTVDFQSEVDAGSLYQLLENQIIPLYYAKPDGKLPLAWLQLMRESIRSVTPVFNTHRMVKEYTERLYTPAAKAHQEFARDDCAAATKLSQWKAQMRKGLAASDHSRCAGRQCRSPEYPGRRSAPGFRESPSRRGRSGPRSRRGLSRRSRQWRNQESGRDGSQREHAGGRRGELPLPGRSPGVGQRNLRLQRARRSDPSASHANARAAFDHLVVTRTFSDILSREDGEGL